MGQVLHGSATTTEAVSRRQIRFQFGPTLRLDRQAVAWPVEVGPEFCKALVAHQRQKLGLRQGLRMSGVEAAVMPGKAK